MTVESLLIEGIGSASILEEGILRNEINPNKEIDPEDLWKLKEANQELSDGKPYGVMIVSNDFSSISSEARKVVASAEFSQNTFAKALIVKNMGLRLMATLYMRINKPITITEAFSDEESALEWLRKQKKRSIS